MRQIRSTMAALVVATIALVDAPLVRAQPQGRLLTGYTVTSWTLADGIPIGPIYAIAQDADGYLWLGTTRGGVRFDGARFTPWDAISSTPLPRGDALALDVSADSTLWVGFARSAGGVTVAALRVGKIESISNGDAPHESTTAVVADRAGRVWAVSDGVLRRLQDGRWDVIRDHVLGDAVVVNVREDASGTIWAGPREALLGPRDGDHFEFVEHGLARDVSESAGGTIWITDPAHGVRRAAC